VFKRILVTLDGSALSEAVLKEVERLAEGTSTKATLLTTVHSRGGTLAWALESPHPVVARAMSPSNETALSAERLGEVERVFERVREELSTYLEEKADGLRAKGIDVENAVEFGEAAETILSYAQTHDVDLIAMATHGRGGLGQLMFGSVTAEVIRSSPVPVLLVRPGGLTEA
jgi:nucleotide-binding universal stress UspA family protein